MSIRLSTDLPTESGESFYLALATKLAKPIFNNRLPVESLT